MPRARQSDHITVNVYYAAACTECEWSMKVEGRAVTMTERQRARDHARRKRHKLEIWERREVRVLPRP